MPGIQDAIVSIAGLCVFLFVAYTFNNYLRDIRHEISMVRASLAEAMEPDEPVPAKPTPPPQKTQTTVEEEDEEEEEEEPVKK